MANTITLFSAGKLVYEDFSALADATVITTENTNFTNVVYDPAHTTDFIKTTILGIPCVDNPDNSQYGYDYGLGITSDRSSDKEIFFQVYSHRTSSARQVMGGGSTAISGSLKLHVFDYINNYATWDVLGHVQYNNYITPRKTMTGLWTMLQTYNSHSEGSEQYIYDVSNDIVVAETKNTYIPISDSFGTGSLIWKVAADTRSGSDVYFAYICITKSKWVTINGVINNMVVQLLDDSDVVVRTTKADSTSIKIDMMKLPMGVKSYKFKIYGTDGSVLLTTDAQQIFGGDTWTYSGDISGPVKSRKRIIIDGGVIG